jgi:hypothetical protein
MPPAAGKSRPVSLIHLARRHFGKKMTRIACSSAAARQLSSDRQSENAGSDLGRKHFAWMMTKADSEWSAN